MNKLIIAVAVPFCVLGSGCCGNPMADIQQQGEAAQADADAFAANVDQNGCLDEGIRRQNQCEPGLSGITCGAVTGIWLQTCLDKATAVSGFCDGVPKITEIKASVAWQLTTCEGLTATDVQACGRLMGSWQSHCEAR